MINSLKVEIKELAEALDSLKGIEITEIIGGGSRLLIDFICSEKEVLGDLLTVLHLNSFSAIISLFPGFEPDTDYFYCLSFDFSDWSGNDKLLNMQKEITSLASILRRASIKLPFENMICPECGKRSFVINSHVTFGIDYLSSHLPLISSLAEKEDNIKCNDCGYVLDNENVGFELEDHLESAIFIKKKYYKFKGIGEFLLLKEDNELTEVDC